MEQIGRIVLTGVLSYVAGSLPSAVLITRWARGIDVREAGSGHAGATNTLRTAGWLPGLLVALLDVGKGFLAVKLALGGGHAMGIVAAAAVVVGHCWPVFAQFRGGMGVATAGGSLLAAGPLGLAIAVGIDSLLSLTLKHTGRANVLTGFTLGPVLWLVGLGLPLAGVGAAAGLVVAVRSLSDWNREYEELWLDRPRRE